MPVDFYALGVTLILMHEMDAMRYREWRIFPLTSFLPDRVGMITFVLLHLPLFYYLFIPEIYTNESFHFSFSIFLIVQLGLHLLFLMHPKNEFKDGLSWGIIVLAALSGGGYLKVG